MDVRGSKPPMDLTDLVTVFVTTVGDKAYPHCIEALDCQDSRFRFAAIENVAPMSAAFQRMIDDCETPYYVQCFPPETPILMGDMTERPIESIKVGDSVCADNNKIGQVSATFSREYEGIIVSVLVGGNSIRPIQATPEHPFFVIPNAQKKRIVNTYRHVDGFIAGERVELRHARDLKVGDLLLMPLNTHTGTCPQTI